MTHSSRDHAERPTEVLQPSLVRKPQRLIAVPVWVAASTLMGAVAVLVLLILGGIQLSDALGEGKAQRLQSQAEQDRAIEDLRLNQCRILLVLPLQDDDTIRFQESKLRCSTDDLPPGESGAPGAPDDPLPYPTLPGTAAPTAGATPSSTAGAAGPRPSASQNRPAPATVTTTTTTVTTTATVQAPGTVGPPTSVAPSPSRTPTASPSPGVSASVCVRLPPLNLCL